MKELIENSSGSSSSTQLLEIQNYDNNYGYHNTNTGNYYYDTWEYLDGSLIFHSNWCFKGSEILDYGGTISFTLSDDSGNINGIVIDDSNYQMNASYNSYEVIANGIYVRLNIGKDNTYAKFDVVKC